MQGIPKGNKYPDNCFLQPGVRGVGTEEAGEEDPFFCSK